MFFSTKIKIFKKKLKIKEQDGYEVFWARQDAILEEPKNKDHDGLAIFSEQIENFKKKLKNMDQGGSEVFWALRQNHQTHLRSRSLFFDKNPKQPQKRNHDGLADPRGQNGDPKKLNHDGLAIFCGAQVPCGVPATSPAPASSEVFWARQDAILEEANPAV